MTKRKRDPKSRKPRTTRIDLPANEAALIFGPEGVGLYMPDFATFTDLPPNVRLAWALCARLSHDPAWVNKVTRELAAWTNEKARESAAAYAKERAASIMVGASHAMH